MRAGKCSQSERQGGNALQVGPKGGMRGTVQPDWGIKQACKEMGGKGDRGRVEWAVRNLVGSHGGSQEEGGQ